MLGRLLMPHQELAIIEIIKRLNLQVTTSLNIDLLVTMSHDVVPHQHRRHELHRVSIQLKAVSTTLVGAHHLLVLHQDMYHHQSKVVVPVVPVVIHPNRSSVRPRSSLSKSSVVNLAQNHPLML